jgi:hypothetical protein
MEMWHLAHLLSPIYCSLAGSPFVGHQPEFFSRTAVGSEAPVVKPVCGTLLAQIEAQIAKVSTTLRKLLVQRKSPRYRDAPMMLARY